MRLKTKIAILLFFLLCSNAWADNQRLVVWLKNGQKVYYELSDEPRTSFENGMLIISSNQIRNEYHLSEILRYTFEGNYTSISSPLVDGMGFRQKEDELDIFGLSDGTEVQIYNSNGILLNRQKADASKSIQFTLANYPAGTYLVKIGERTLKFMKR